MTPFPVIALAYDFDGTLTPRPMQEYTVFKAYDIDPAAFWREVNAAARKESADPMLVYMRRMIEEVAARGGRLTNELMASLAGNIEFHPGVVEWFERINRYVEAKTCGGIRVQHYILSCGNREIIDACVIAEHFHRIYASAYHYNAEGVADFPSVVVTDSVKPQFLFRINKGREELTDSVNEHMALSARPIPFKQILYVGDGLTDVPCMAVTRQYGGHAIAVYAGNDTHAQAICRRLWEDGRADFDAPADFSEGSLLDQRIKMTLDLKIANILMDLEHPSRPGKAEK